MSGEDNQKAKKREEKMLKKFQRTKIRFFAAQKLW
jgi:hypothetical protein